MADRTSALAGHYQTGRFGIDGDTGVTLTVDLDLTLHQIAFWPGLEGEQLLALNAATGLDQMPSPGRSLAAEDHSVLRIEPLKVWLFGATAALQDPQTGSALDLSHSRTHIEISGTNSSDLLNRLLPLDLRSDAMPDGAVASSALHHVGVTLWRRADGETWSLFVPRGFAVSVWEILFETATQFGVQVENR